MNDQAKYRPRLAGLAKGLLDPDDAILCLLDHQAGLVQTVKDIGIAELRANATMLARLANLLKIPLLMRRRRATTSTRCWTPPATRASSLRASRWAVSCKPGLSPRAPTRYCASSSSIGIVRTMRSNRARAGTGVTCTK